MVIIGIDAGLSGACAAIHVSDMGGIAFIAAIPVPIIPDGNQRQIDCGALGAWFEEIGPDACLIENVQPMPSIADVEGKRRSMGATSAFRFGFACGQIRGCVQAYQIPLTLVHPISWKKHFGLKGPNKEQSRQLALKLVPDAAESLRLKKSHNLAEGLLIAIYGAHQRGWL